MCYIKQHAFIHNGYGFNLKMYLPYRFTGLIFDAESSISWLSYRSHQSIVTGRVRHEKHWKVIEWSTLVGSSEDLTPIRSTATEKRSNSRMKPYPYADVITKVVQPEINIRAVHFISTIGIKIVIISIIIVTSSVIWAINIVATQLSLVYLIVTVSTMIIIVRIYSMGAFQYKTLV